MDLYLKMMQFIFLLSIFLPAVQNKDLFDNKWYNIFDIVIYSMIATLVNTNLNWNCHIFTKDNKSSLHSQIRSLLTLFRNQQKKMRKSIKLF